MVCEFGIAGACPTLLTPLMSATDGALYRRRATRGVGSRHHLYSNGLRLSLSGRGDGLGEPLRACMVSTADAVLLAYCERRSEHFSLGLSFEPGGRGENVVGLEALRIRNASRVVSAEEGQGVFPWPTTRDVASQPMNEIG
jgi:hypothetical protein